MKTDGTSNAVTDARDAVSEDAILGGVMRCSDAHSCAWGSPSFLDLWVLIKFGSVSFSSNLENISLNICHVPFLFGRLQLHLYKATWNCPTAQGCSVHCSELFFIIVFHLGSQLLQCPKSVIFSSATSNLLLIPSSGFFTSDNVVFISRSWICLTYTFHISFLNIRNGVRINYLLVTA